MRTTLLAAALALAACGGAPPQGFTHTVDPSLAQAIPPSPAKPLAAARTDDGEVYLFVADELLVRPSSQAELDELLARVGGEVVETDAVPAPPASLQVTVTEEQKAPTQYVVRVDRSRAELGRLDADGAQVGYTGQVAFSSEDAARLVAMVTREKAAGRTVAPNFVFTPGLLQRTEEHPSGAGHVDAFMAPPYQATGNRSNVVGLWQYVDAVPPPRRSFVAIIDSGFWVDATGRALSSRTPAVVDLPELPVQYDFQGDDYVVEGRNLARCSGGFECPWHGQGAAGVAVARLDNRYGGAGTGGQVADPMLFNTSLDWGQVARAIRTAVAWRADVVSMSFSASCDNAFCDLYFEGNLYPALRNARDNGVVLVAAAGNAAQSANGKVPCKAAEDVICVGALEPSSTRAIGYSNSGSAVDIWAPTDIMTHPDPDSGDAQSYFNGTSASAPFVAGVAAVLKAYAPALTSGQVAEIFSRTGWRGSTDPKVTVGLDAYRALRDVATTNAPPSVSIVAREGTTVQLNATASFVASAMDLESGADCCTFSWTPAPAAATTDGRSVTFTFTTPGPARLTVRATDRSGATAEATLDVTVVNSPPVAEILQPAASLTVAAGLPVQLSGRGRDLNEPGGEVGCSALTWLSDVASDVGFPATGCEVSRTFATAGARTLRLVATDAQGLSAVATVRVTVTPAPVNFPPSITLGALPPTTYTGFAGGYRWTDTLAVSASATDPEGNTPLSFRWYVTTFRPGSSTVYSARAPLGSPSATAGLSWRPDTTPSRFGGFAELGNDCYSGQEVLAELEATDSLGNVSVRALRRFTVYRCILE